MNVYDFDETIFKGDSTRRFWLFCFRRHPLRVARSFGTVAAAAVRFALGNRDLTAFKERFFTFLVHLEDPEGEVEAFWDSHMGDIRRWYLKVKEPEDLVISASPEFLIAPPCARLGIRPPIASQVDIRTGRYTGINCKGQEKVRRFRELYPKDDVRRFYSDSHSDLPMAQLAEESFLVKGEEVAPWNVHQTP